MTEKIIQRIEENKASERKKVIKRACKRDTSAILGNKQVGGNQLEEKRIRRKRKGKRKGSQKEGER